ncbi:MAG: NmrA family NAD(P)-binding protein [Nocardiopsaceae bacterium]|nr:NmrA family NAD(P)-binding protein [Nocardiopsaceae bacterium]
MDGTYLVIGAGGAQGGAVARRLVEQGDRVRGLSRSGTGTLPGVEWVKGDLADRAALRAAFDGVTHASVTLPMADEPALVADWVDAIVKAASAGGLRRLVVNIANRLPAIRTSVDVFETRWAAAEALLASGVPTVVLRPPVYLDNLCAPWVSEALVADGMLTYPIPAGHRVAWLSHDDLGTLTAAAFHRDDLVGTAIDVGGRDVVTGPELAAAFAAVLDRTVTYREVPVDAFEAGLAEVLGPKRAAGVAETYRWLAGPGGADLYEGVPDKVEAAFGVRLTPLYTWIAARTWRAAR